MNAYRRILRKWVKIRLCPIRVYCLHHVCRKYNMEYMHACDWMALEDFKQKVLDMQQSGIKFISLSVAHDKLVHSHSPFAIRLKKYAVLSFDDGYASLKEILPWLKEQNIPVALFINPDYAAGKAYRETDKEKYLTIEELAELDVEIGMHGLQHLDVTQMNEEVFRKFVESSFRHSINSSLKHFIPFWAYTWGRHNAMTDSVLNEYGIVPVYIDGTKNFSEASCIHRELLI